MNESSKKEKREFLLKFQGHNSVQILKDIFSQIAEKKIEVFLLDKDYKSLKDKKRQNRHILKSLKKTKKSGGIQSFNCSCNKSCLSIPIIQGDNLYGYILAVHLRSLPDKNECILIKSFVDIALKEFQKEKELTKLYDTIRPRAIALSTIHTVHRLLTSTLDMDELIERIARLTLQVMRSRHCSIMLIDESGKYLIPKAIIDLKNNKQPSHKKDKKIRIGFDAMGKVAKIGKATLSHNCIYVPLVEEDIIGVICARNKINNAPFNNFDLEILLTLAEQAVIAIKNAQLYEEQKKMAYGSIKSLVALLDTKSPHTFTHSEIFLKIILAIAEEMKLPRKEIRNLRYAALLPDTGKFSIPDEILEKRDNLSKKDHDIIKKQHLESLKILEPLEFLRPAMPIITYHHERYDGTGYPEGLKGEEIPIGARIMGVADALEAMISSRPYKDANISIPQALKEIKNNTGTQFDPKVVDALVTISKRPEFENLFTVDRT